jgi:hypothetical protein
MGVAMNEFISAFSLAIYLLNFEVEQVPLSSFPKETETHVYSRYVAYAENAAEVSLDPNEDSLFPGEDGRVKTALLIMAVRTFESFQKEGPIHGDCHENADRQCRKETDKPHSFCHMQIQPGVGIVLDKKYWRYALPGELSIHSSDLDADDKLCDRVGLHMMRQSLAARKDLTVYTGEELGGKMAKNRMNLAQRWYASHPINNFYSLPTFKIDK